jgi:hypothetical protein
MSGSVAATTLASGEVGGYPGSRSTDGRAAMMYCGACGVRLSEAGPFCPGCGRRSLIPSGLAGSITPVTRAGANGATPLVRRDDAAAAFAARRELGGEREPEVVDAFVDRIEGVILARVDAHLAERAPAHPAAGRALAPGVLPLALGSLAAAVPLSAIGAAAAGTEGLIAVWIGITLINVAHGVRGWFR